MGMEIEFTKNGFLIFKGQRPTKIERYIINENATIIFWNDGTKTVSKRHKDDIFDKELGFLFAHYYKHCGLSNASRKRVIETIDYKHIKTFLFEMFVKNSGLTPEKARSYLKNLKSDVPSYMHKPLIVATGNKEISVKEEYKDWLLEEFKKLDDRIKQINN